MKTHVEFFNGQKIPIVGLGTWQATDEDEIENAVDAALKIGYRHFDTAFLYTNEASIGKTLTKWLSSGKITRDELFIVTKLPGIAMQPDRVEEYLNKSLTSLNLEYVDLYLIHSPVGMQNFGDTELFPMRDGKLAIDLSTDLEAIWKAMEAQVDAGRTKAIGISNFSRTQVERLVKFARIPPANHQVELNVFIQQKPLREVCAKHNITMCAYAPFGSPGRKALYEKRGSTFVSPGLLENPVVAAIASTHNKTPAQILLRFLTQQEIVVIPKSVNAERLQSNFKIMDFDLTVSEMKQLDELDKGVEGRTFSMAGFAGISEHPEFPGNEY